MSYRKIPKPIIQIIREIRFGEFSAEFDEENFNLKINLASIISFEADIFITYNEKENKLKIEIVDGGDNVLMTEIDLSPFGGNEFTAIEHISRMLSGVSGLLCMKKAMGVIDAPKGK